MIDIFKRAAFLGLGAFAVTREKLEQLIEEMVKKGEISGEEGRKLLDDLVARGKEQGETLRRSIREELEKFKAELGLVSKKEYDALEARLKDLERKNQSGGEQD